LKTGGIQRDEIKNWAESTRRDGGFLPNTAMSDVT
jgi:hypothetical protein